MPCSLGVWFVFNRDTAAAGLLAWAGLCALIGIERPSLLRRNDAVAFQSDDTWRASLEAAFAGAKAATAAARTAQKTSSRRGRN